MSLTTSERLQLALAQDHNGNFYPFDDFDLLNDAAEELDHLRAEVARLKEENETPYGQVRELKFKLENRL